MRQRVFPIPLLAFLLLFAWNASAAPPDVGTLDWSVKAPHNLAANRPSDDEILNFMSELEGGPGYPVSICYARFVDLRDSGTLSLIVSEGDGRFCHLVVVDKAAGGFDMYTFDLAHFAGAPEIKDLGGDRRLELIAPADLTDYDGAQHCIATWDVIYAWTGSNYTDVSSQYKQYYEHKLASLQKEIEVAEKQKERAEQASAAQGVEPAVPATSPEILMHPIQSEGEKALEPVQGGYQSWQPVGPSALQPPAPPEPDRLGLDCQKAEAAKIERFLGSRDAGMSDAIKWKNSDNPDDREFADSILADIASPEAIGDLQELQHDSNRAMARDAGLSLQQANGGPQKYAVERDFIPVINGKPSPK